MLKKNWLLCPDVHRHLKVKVFLLVLNGNTGKQGEKQTVLETGEMLYHLKTVIKFVYSISLRMHW